MSDILSRAIIAATAWHQNQIDKGGNPYILHPLQVMLRLQGQSMDVKCAAVLHDLLEDTAATPHLVFSLFGKRVAELVDILTRRQGEDYFAYIDRVKVDADAAHIKLADLAENLRTDRGAPADKDREFRYRRAVNVLIAAVLP